MRFIHLADVHLGAVPDAGFPWSRKREEEIWNTFRRVFDDIRKNPVELLFIAGDLFHRQPTRQELKEVNYLFQSIPDTTIVLIAGNHDYLKKGSLYDQMVWAANVIFLKENSCACVEIPELQTFVYGLSYDRKEITEELYHQVKPVEQEGFHVLLAHGGDQQHIPIRKEILRNSGFDYVALGHIHKPHALLKNQMVYAGALEPIDRNDIGPHGYIKGVWENGEVRVKFRRIACRSYFHEFIQMDEETTQIQLEEELRRRIQEQGEEQIYKVILQGQRSPELVLLTERLKRIGNVVEVEDQTRPSYDLKKLLRQYEGTLIGEYIRYFEEIEDRTVVEEKALYYGLQALLETRS